MGAVDRTSKYLDVATKIFVEHGSAIRAMIRDRGVNKDEEQDIYDNLYLSLVCNPIPPSVTNTLAYLNTVIKNEIIDAARRRKRYREMIARYAGKRTDNEGHDDPGDEIIREEEKRKIAEFVQRSLSPHEARAVLERYAQPRYAKSNEKSPERSQERLARWLRRWSYWIPRAQREPFIGDILEDTAEMRQMGMREWRIRLHVIWQLLFAIRLLPSAALLNAVKKLAGTK
jgi:DNA-directed RNA polymerase specialized sigma24 family protein